jgi:type IV pilus assembly protein PilB
MLGNLTGPATLSLATPQESDPRHADEKITADSESSESAPAVKLLDQIFHAAVRDQASDIHLEAYHHSARVRFRIDGRLTAHDSYSMALHQQLISRLKILAELDITERRQPQDGRISLSLPKSESVQMRLSILPTAYGEKAVIRVQNHKDAALPLSQLGLEKNQINQVKASIGHHQGLILVTGPTGSGKTQSLYAILEQMNQVERNLVTLEDPVEMNLPGINQVAVSASSKMTFQNALKSLLRQDPDVIMLGEIRDRETADTAIKAAQTGHLMLSTLHTNGCTESLIRLLNLGIAPYNLSDTLTLIMAQRLLRKLCRHCKRPLSPTALSNKHHTLSPKKHEPAKCYEPVGCNRCQQGYRGRMAIFELLPVDENLSQCLADNSPLPIIREQCQRLISTTLTEAAISAWTRGLTSYQEITPYLPSRT